MTILNGRVGNHLEPRLRLRIRGADRVEHAVTATLDTGYSGVLSIPPALAESLNLEFVTFGQGQLADGSSIRYDMFFVEVMIGEEWIAINASTIGPEALVGMQLLAGSHITIHAVPGGSVRISHEPT